MGYTKHARLETTRKRLGVKRSALAQRTGLSYQHIYGMERGFTAVADETLAVVANALGVPLEDIQEISDEPSDPVASGPATEAGRSAEEVRRAS